MNNNASFSTVSQQLKFMGFLFGFFTQGPCTVKKPGFFGSEKTILSGGFFHSPQFFEFFHWSFH
jgi:hypothetical protein